MKFFKIVIGLLILLPLSCTKEEEEVMIRVENTSPYTYTNIIVAAGIERLNYGNLKTKEVSEYKLFETAYSYAFIELKIDSAIHTIQPIDFVGETPLKKGKYTYQIGATDSGSQYGRLTLTLKEDGK